MGEERQRDLEQRARRARMISAGISLVFAIAALLSGQPVVGLLLLVLGGLLVLRLALVRDAPRSVRKGGALPAESDPEPDSDSSVEEIDDQDAGEREP